MATLGEHLERVRAKPHDDRRRIAFALSLLITGLVATGWVGALASSGTLAIKDRPTAGVAENMEDTRTNFTELLGAAGAAVGASTSPAQIVVVDGATYSTLDERPDNLNNTHETVITF